MLTQDENELLTRVGAGTPMGALLRRYWHPIAAASELDERWTKRVRILGEDLVLFKNRSGEVGLIGEQCPHRRASMAYGIPTADGIRCPYHGWKFDATGACLEQPNEPEGSGFKDKVRLPGYPVRELAGVLFAYLGPLPAPRLPNLDGYHVQPAIRLFGTSVIPCNWLQIMENSVDPIHSEWLHGHFPEFLTEHGGTRRAFSGRHLRIAFDEVPYGIVKRRLKEGQSEDCSDWRVGHPLVFPNVLAVGNADATMRVYEFQIRVPIDDTHTNHVWFTAFVPHDPSLVPQHLRERTFAYEVPPGGEGEYLFELSEHQDVMAWATQGSITDRRLEHLGATDRGITLYRQLLKRELARVAAGEDPLLVLRGDDDGSVLQLPAEHDKAHFSAGFETIFRRRNWRYAPVGEELLAVFRAARERLPAAR